MTSPIKNKKNLIVDTATQCNLLCKIVIDYMSNKKCHIVEDKTDPINIKKYIQYEEGSFINYRDTNYEVDKIYFFSPSRHSVDGEKFDLEVNIHHGGERIIAHNHYHNDVEDTTPLRKHFHYHSKKDKDSDNNHHEAKQAGIKSEIVSCILFNIGEHKGSEVNVFFNQFVHKLDSLDTKEPKISVHSNWNIDKLLPKRKSYFMYEYKKGENDYNVIVFDNIQSIESGIFEIIKDKCFPPISNTEINTLKDASLFYRTNVEMITDEQYKKSKRDQIKDLLSIVRLNYMKDDIIGSKEYISRADDILASATGTGSLSSFQDKQSTAIEVANMWNQWGQGVFTDITPKLIDSKIGSMTNLDEKSNYYKRIKFDTDGYDYLGAFERQFKKKLEEIFKNFYGIDNFSINEVELEEIMNKPEYANSLHWKNNKELMKIDNIRKCILYYNKLIKCEENVGEIIDENFNKIISGKNNSIQGILKELITLTTTNNIVDDNTGDYGTYYLNLSMDYKYKIYKNIPTGSVTIDLLDEENILYETFLPYINTKKKKTIIYKIYDIANDILISNNINKDKETKSKEYDKILLQVYRFFISLSGKYTDPEQITNILSQQNYLFILNNTLWREEETKIADIFNLDTKINTNNGYEYIIKPNDIINLKETKQHGGDRKGYSPKYWKTKILERGTLPIQSYVNKLSPDAVKIDTGYEVEKSNVNVPYYEFKFYKKNDQFLFDRPDETGKGNLFVDMSSIKGDKMNLTVFDNNFDALVIQDFIIYNTDGTGEWINAGRGNDNILVNGWKRQQGDGKLNADLEMFVWKKMVGMIISFTPRYDICIGNIMSWCAKNDFDIKLQVAGPEMDHTIDNEECQDWLSNETHYEGSFWKFWEKPEIYSKNGKTWDNLSYKEKNNIRNGLLKSHSGDENESNLTDQEAFDLDNNTEGKKTLKWFRHNKCRNPGNVKAAPWCYTKNPKRRWNYCVKPDYTKYIARIVLVCVFIMVGIVAIVFVKYLFRFEIISKIVAALTGANFASEAIFKANQTVNNIKTNVKSITG